jgi:GT2 family glycosyltransferase
MSRIMEQLPYVCVVVINWNGRRFLTRCFDSLHSLDYPSVGLILVDNGSEDGSVELVKERYPDVKIVANPTNLGFCRACNQGIREAINDGARYVVLLNNDTEVEERWLSELVKAAEARPGVGALSSKILFMEHRNIVNSTGLCCSVIGNAWDRGIGQPNGEHWDEPTAVLGASGGALFLRTDAVKKVGPLPKFGIYLEDMDISLRLWDAGYEIRYVPTAVLYHHFSATMGEKKNVWRKEFLNARNRFRLIMRQFPISRLPSIAANLLKYEAKAVGRPIKERKYWKSRAEIAAIVAAIAYVPDAVVERCKRLLSGRWRCKFWDMIDKERGFFEGFTLPDSSSGVSPNDAAQSGVDR